MARIVHHEHNHIKDLKVKQFKKSDLTTPVTDETLKKGESVTLESANDPYYLEFQVKGNEYCTIDFDKTYGVKKFTRKKHEQNPQIDRLIFKVENLASTYDNSPKPDDDNVKVKDPDDEPFVK